MPVSNSSPNISDKKRMTKVDASAEGILISYPSNSKGQGSQTGIWVSGFLISCPLLLGAYGIRVPYRGSFLSFLAVVSVSL